MFRLRDSSEPWWEPSPAGERPSRRGIPAARPDAPAALGETDNPGRPALPLARLHRGQEAWVLDLAGDSGLRHRLQALGLRPGQRIQVLRRAPWGGPLHLQVGMTELMLRRRDATRIAVTRRDPRR